MNPIALNLVVLRSTDMERAAKFYSLLGLNFTRHRHGSGPEHFAAEVGGGVFEIYPQAADGPSTLGTRIGFSVRSLDSAINALSEYPGAVISAPKDSQWGRRAVIADPDGHRIELVESAGMRPD
ncbi:MAG: VOC family protein [Verrucomicrobiota bacterium]